MVTHSSVLAWRIPWTGKQGCSPEGCKEPHCELGFLSNEHDRQVLLNDQRGIAKALTRAVDAYIASLHEEPGPQTADLLAKESL